MKKIIMNLSYHELTCGEPYWRGSKKNILKISAIFIKHNIDYKVNGGAIQPLSDFVKAKELTAAFFLEKGELWETY